MDLPFIYKYQPLYLQDFEMDEKLLELIRILIKMFTLRYTFVGKILISHQHVFKFI